MPPKLPIPLRDLLGRPLESLRLSVTDRCNLRCLYCMPEEDYVWLPRQELLSFEELVRLVDIFTGLGVNHLRLTGGEPLLRQNLDRLVAMLAQNARITDLAITTNGDTFCGSSRGAQARRPWPGDHQPGHVAADRFRQMTRRDEHQRVLSAFDAARRAGFTSTKLDAVIMRGENDDELADLIEFGRSNGVEVRFIEYMDVLGATKWSMAKVVSRDEMLQRLEQRYGKITPAGGNELGSRFTISAARRHRLRNYCLHDFAVLPDLRSQPHNRGWDVVSLLVCHERHRPAEAVARLRER